MGADGFRFDLATTLGRGPDGAFRSDHPLFQAIAQDPVLGRLKMIAEPWDIGPDGYRLGGFPPPFASWNDRFRDGVRRFWRGDEAMLPELARRLLGSADLFEHGGHGPQASVNFVASHDGFTTRDLVTYAKRHNEANGEANQDGHHDETSANYGVEGPSPDPAIEALRARQRRNLLATLFLSQGTPMLLMGDEVGRSQKGNNNAYCQDTPTSWLDWAGLAADDRAFQAFVARLARLRREHPALRRRRFLHGRAHDAKGVPDVAWLAADGQRQALRHWHDPRNRCLGVLLGGGAGPDLDETGREAVDAMLLLLLNAHDHAVPFAPPQVAGVAGWRLLLDTADPDGEGYRHPTDAALTLEARSLRLLEGEG
jgi:glycogen operon protein